MNPLNAEQIVTTINLCAAPSQAQVTTQGFLNLSRTEAPNTLLSHAEANDSEAMCHEPLRKIV